MELILDVDKIAILDNLLCIVNYNYPYPSTSTNFVCCEVVRRYFCKMKYEGPYCRFSNLPEYADFNLDSLKEFLELKNSNIESVLLLGIKDNDYGIVDYFLFNGRDNLISCDDYFVSKAVDRIIEWHNKGYKVINIHNHPFAIAALPSLEDLSSFENFSASKEWAQCEERYQIKLPNDFSFFDFGIVTKYDYFSISKNSSRLNEIKRIAEVFKNEMNIKPEFSDEELFVWDPLDEFGVSAQGIFKGLEIYFKIS